ncbi:hypothetical protein JJL56_01525 [Azospirillum sp. YIM DDC1]|uniref:DNA phosphorothioation-associated protein 4 n=1 Tax=Azospirillum aestuarii TaxID=2802052 RepID=A0ABS1HT21_9PROT|nr:hypothetical protein [Azospirillum aestuarii]MBK4717542.1 hypothetical protein [Azospirillum aestuarii]
MRGVKRSAAHEEMVRRLAEAQHPSTGKSVFPTMRELMVFAAALGFENGLRRPLQGATHEIDARQFEGATDSARRAMDIIYLIALAGEKDVEVLRETAEDRMLAVFEEFANGGFEVLAGWLSEKPDDLDGDEAILVALSRHGFLESEASVDGLAREVEF